LGQKFFKIKAKLEHLLNFINAKRIFDIINFSNKIEDNGDQNNFELTPPAYLYYVKILQLNLVFIEIIVLCHFYLNSIDLLVKQQPQQQEK
jgi:hypothetical protein